MMEVPFMSIMSDKNVIWMYNWQAILFSNEVVDEMYVSASCIMCLSLYRWGLNINVSFNFNSTSYFLNNRTRSLNHRLLMWYIVNGYF